MPEHIWSHRAIAVLHGNVLLSLEPFFLRTTVEFAVTAVLTRHHRFEIVPAGKGVCASVSDPPADTLLRFGPLPNIKNPCEVEVNPISPVSHSYATSRLGNAEAIDYLSNTDFRRINYLLVAANLIYLDILTSL